MRVPSFVVLRPKFRDRVQLSNFRRRRCLLRHLSGRARGAPSLITFLVVSLLRPTWLCAMPNEERRKRERERRGEGGGKTSKSGVRLAAKLLHVRVRPLPRPSAGCSRPPFLHSFSTGLGAGPKRQTNYLVRQSAWPLLVVIND